MKILLAASVALLSVLALEASPIFGHGSTSNCNKKGKATGAKGLGGIAGIFGGGIGNPASGILAAKKGVSNAIGSFTGGKKSAPCKTCPDSGTSNNAGDGNDHLSGLTGKLGDVKNADGVIDGEDVISGTIDKGAGSKGLSGLGGGIPDPISGKIAKAKGVLKVIDSFTGGKSSPPCKTCSDSGTSTDANADDGGDGSDQISGLTGKLGDVENADSAINGGDDVGGTIGKGTGCKGLGGVGGGIPDPVSGKIAKAKGVLKVIDSFTGGKSSAPCKTCSDSGTSTDANADDGGDGSDQNVENADGAIDGDDVVGGAIGKGTGSKGLGGGVPDPVSGKIAKAKGVSKVLGKFTGGKKSAPCKKCLDRATKCATADDGSSAPCKKCSHHASKCAKSGGGCADTEA